MLFAKQIFFLCIVTLFTTSVCKREIVKELTKRFYDKQTKCLVQYKAGKGFRPAYECSGILIRGVNDKKIHKELKNAWDFKSSNRQRKSFSMTFLRKDSPFSQFPSGYNTGFILYPHLKTPNHKNRKGVYCAFPLDGHTDEREGHGCGKSKQRDDPKRMSKHCDQLKITSFKKWKEHYRIVRKNKVYFVRGQCAFDMTLATAARDFEIILKANHFLRTDNDAKRARYSYRNNEVLLETWNTQKPEYIPIEAFFYLLNGPKKAKIMAEGHRWDYFEKTGEIIPIVGIKLPTRKDPNIYIV